eukprot:Polyplicarium_translucidae@DN1950_c0_g1_i2.p1
MKTHAWISDAVGVIRFVTCINSIGNAIALDVERECAVIRPNSGLGGLCGAAVKPVGLSNVYNFRKRLPNEIDIVGVGGVSSGTDVYEYLLVGASCVQIGATLWEEGV